MSSVDGRVMKTDEVRGRKFSKQMKLRTQQKSCLSVCWTFILYGFYFQRNKAYYSVNFLMDDIPMSTIMHVHYVYMFN